MNSHFDVIVVGTGSMGMAACYFLAKQGYKTLGVDSFDPPHSNGSHHGDTRIIRYAYGEDRRYVPLVLRAKELWDELEIEAGTKLFHQTGMLSLGVPGSKFIEEVIASAKEFSLPLEIMTGTEIRQRWSGITVPDDYVGCYESSSGVLMSEECVRSYRQLALEQGAALWNNSPVTNLQIFQTGVSIETKAGLSATADKLIVCAGAWSGKLLRDLQLPLAPTRKVVGWFEAEQSLFDFSHFPPIFLHESDRQYYAFPCFDDNGLKAGRHDLGQVLDPDTIDRTFGVYPEDEADIRNFLEKYMPNAAGKLRRGTVCLYTRTPDEHFIIDRHPEFAHVAIAAGFSGHGFKFSSAVGEVLGSLVLDKRVDLDLSLFSITRPELRNILIGGI